MHFTRPRELAVAGLLGLVLVYLLFQVAYGAIPALPLFAGVTLLVLALCEAVLAFIIRSRIKEGRVAAAISVARSVALAKASSLAGSAMTGAWLAAIAYLFPRREELFAATGDLRSATVGIGSSIALVAAALWLEHCCRTPEGGDRDRDVESTG